MKFIAKNWWKVSLCLIVFGVFVGFLGWTLGGYKSFVYVDKNGIHIADKNASDITISETFTDDFFDSVEIDIASANIIFVEATNFGFDLNVSANEGDINWNLVNNKLVIKNQSPFYSFNLFNFDIYNDHYIYVYYPAGSVFKEIKCVNTSSDITINSYLQVEKLHLTTVSGKMDLFVADCPIIDLNTASDNINLTTKGFTSSINVTSISGAVKLNIDECESLVVNSTSDNINIVGSNKGLVDLKITSISGDINLKDLLVKNGIINNTSGRIEAHLSFTESFKIESISGDVDVLIEGIVTDYAYNLSSIAGDVKVNNENRGNKVISERSSGAYPDIYVHTTSGDIKLFFTK